MSSYQPSHPNGTSLARFAFGDGEVRIDRSDGAPVGFFNARQPNLRFLLGEAEAWHYAPMRWGKGFLIANGCGRRWDHPEFLQFDKQGVTCRFAVNEHLLLSVRRETTGLTWRETYTLHNHASSPLVLGSLGVSTPFRDIYPSAREALTACCHAHIWTGGAHSWVWALPMSGGDPGLGLALTEGELWAYSIESRHQWTGSNVRGHIFLHLTDHCRSPLAFGGQPEITLAAHESMTWAWELGWYRDFSSFESDALRPPMRSARLATEVDNPLVLELAPTAVIDRRATAVALREREGLVSLKSDVPGVHHVDFAEARGRSRAAILVHQPLQRLVESRIHYILSHQVGTAAGADDEHAGAFLPVDSRNGLPIVAAGWMDWSDGRERIAMPILLQTARRLGWAEAAAVDEATAKFGDFARRHLLRPDGTLRDSSREQTPNRLYNYPWLAEFFLNEYDLRGCERDLRHSARILHEYYARGGAKFLAFLEPAERLVNTLRRAGLFDEAELLVNRILFHAETFVSLGQDLPGHEVRYEQSMVAPLVLLLQMAGRLARTDQFRSSIDERLRWLQAFEGDQPHARLRHIAIRHWDGFWFGIRRQWGDVFPHYWSVLSAAAYAGQARDLIARGENLDEAGRLRRRAEAIFLANLASFYPNGAATCAFVFPSCVDGQPAHADDPMANDQDWALVWFLRYLDVLRPLRIPEVREAAVP
ncbi:MAG: hypothetical protein SFU53_05810 [Terrimicrobiaceae bacterium]|nr:hypothetical protein [Terrimicrobiaceae bacterium]